MITAGAIALAVFLPTLPFYILPSTFYNFSLPFFT